MDNRLDRCYICSLIKCKFPRAEVQLVSNTAVGEDIPMDSESPKRGLQLLEKPLNGGLWACYLDVVDMLAQDEDLQVPFMKHLELRVNARGSQTALVTGDLAKFEAESLGGVPQSCARFRACKYLRRRVKILVTERVRSSGMQLAGCSKQTSRSGLPVMRESSS